MKLGIAIIATCSATLSLVQPGTANATYSSGAVSKPLTEKLEADVLKKVRLSQVSWTVPDQTKQLTPAQGREAMRQQEQQKKDAELRKLTPRISIPKNPSQK